MKISPSVTHTCDVCKKALGFQGQGAAYAWGEETAKGYRGFYLCDKHMRKADKKWFHKLELAQNESDEFNRVQARKEKEVRKNLYV